MDGTVLVADDDRTIRTVLTQALTRAGCRVHATSSLTTLMRWVGEGMGDAVITDVMMPDGNGLEMLPKIAEDRPGLPVIVISAQNTIMTAIKAEEAAAFDYLPKPFDLPDIMKRTARALETRARSTVRAAPPERPEDLPLIGRTPVMQALYRVVARVMNADLPVMINGASGTGKTLIAHVLHDLSDRRGQTLVVLGPNDLSEPDSATRALARARGGTILLDEIGEFDAEAQAAAVRLTDVAGEGAPRFVATRQIGPGQMAGPGTLRDDLFYRLSGAVIDVPALCDRADDIPLLAEHVLRAAQRDGMPHRRLSDEARELLRRYSWPGNVRQLENILRRLVLTASAEDITAADVEEVLGGQPNFSPAQSGAGGDSLSASVAGHIQRYFDMHGNLLPPAGLYARILRQVEAPMIEIALEATGGNQAKCAELLGINRNTLRKKLTELDIRVTRRRKLM